MKADFDWDAAAEKIEDTKKLMEAGRKNLTKKEREGSLEHWLTRKGRGLKLQATPEFRDEIQRIVLPQFQVGSNQFPVLEAGALWRMQGPDSDRDPDLTYVKFRNQFYASLGIPKFEKRALLLDAISALIDPKKVYLSRHGLYHVCYRPYLSPLIPLPEERWPSHE